jgi:hypothetical protein
MNDLTRLEHLILATLEEAGEENVAALTNTVLKLRHGSPDEIGTMITALTRLLEAGLVEAARFRDKASRYWMPLTREESLAIIAALGLNVRWSAAEQLWKWCEDTPRAEILLTDLGLTTARQILRESGWPPELT